MAKAGLQHSSGGSLTSLQIGRGLAALAVVWHHAGMILGEARYLGPHDVPFDAWLFPGYHGVDYFFVLSGFIIAHAHWNDFGNPMALGRYAWRRAIRIFPPYWVITLILVCIYVSRPELGAASQREPFNIITSMFLLPTADAPVLTVAWTLRYEMLFYLAFAFFIVYGPRFGVALFTAWVLYILISQEPLTQRVSLASHHVLQFLLGMVACYMVRRLPLARRPASLVALLGCATLVIAYALEAWLAPTFWADAGNPYLALRDEWALPAWGLGSALAIYGLARRDQAIAAEHAAAPAAAPAPRVSPLLAAFKLLGDASYSLYLVHVLALTIVVTLIFRLVPSMTAVAPLIVVVLILAGVLAGILFHLWVEKPLLARIPKNPPALIRWGGRAKDAAPK